MKAESTINSDLQSVHAATRRALLKIKGFSEIKVEKVKEAIQKCLVRDCPSRVSFA